MSARELISYSFTVYAEIYYLEAFGRQFFHGPMNGSFISQRVSRCPENAGPIPKIIFGFPVERDKFQLSARTPFKKNNKLL